MVQILVILIVATVLVSQELPGLPLIPDEPALSVAAWSLAPLLVVMGALHSFLSWCGMRMDRSGDLRFARRGERAMMMSRIAILAIHVFGVIGLGWLGVARHWLGGDLILIDEALVILPPIAAVVCGWWSFAGIDRRLHESVLMRRLDEGQTPPALPTRAAYVIEHARHEVLLLLIPIGAILAWSEAIDRFGWRFVEDQSVIMRSGGAAILAGVHLAGVLLVVLLMPLALRAIWRTTPLGPGPTRERLDALCRSQRVRCRDILVWRTQSGILNGAVIGLIPRFRFILLTEALLEQLPETQVEAVAAHEVAHARWRHLPWLMLALIVSVGSAWTVAAWGLEAALDIEALSDRSASALLLGALGAATIVGLVIFGFVSRRFEEQADAFAAQHLSGASRTGGSDGDLTITSEAASAMAGALGAVAALNCLPVDRFMWRHGSIRSRQKRLFGLVGQSAVHPPIDWKVRRLKIATLIVLVALVVLGSARPELLAG